MEQDWIPDNSLDFPEFITKKLAYLETSRNDVTPEDILRGKRELMPHQKIVIEYMKHYRAVLLYHALGTGKTLIAIKCAEEYPDRQKLVFLPASLKSNFINELLKEPKYAYPKGFSDMTEKDQKRIKKDIRNQILSHYTFISTNAPNFADQVYRLSLTKEQKKKFKSEDDEEYKNFVKNVAKKSLDGKMIIIDEVHNFMGSVINAAAKNAFKVYELIMKARDIKIIVMSGSPIQGDAFSICMLLNMLRGYITDPNDPKARYTAFPTKQSIFKKYFIDGDSNTFINKHIFMERATGLISYYADIKDIERKIFPELNPMKVIQIQMSKFQWQQYASFRMREIREEKLAKYSREKFVEKEGKKPARESNTTYRIKTLQVSNFAIPEYAPKPKFKPGDDRQQREKDLAGVVEKIKLEDLEGDRLERFSPKMYEILKILNKENKRLSFVYSQFTSIEGLGVFAKVLEANGYEQFKLGAPLNPKKDYMRFIVVYGDIDPVERERLINENFNRPDNKHGRYIRVLLASVVAAEGITLHNVRTVHIMEPFWHWSRIRQITGRAKRMHSHTDLPKEEREIDTYIYLAVPPKGVNPQESIGEFEGEISTDIHIFEQAKRGMELIDQIQMALRESAFDCQLNYEHNKSTLPPSGCPKCVKLPEDQLKKRLMYVPNLDLQMIPGQSFCFPEKKNIKLIRKKIDGIWRLFDKKGKEYIQDERTKEWMPKKLS